MFVYIIMWPGLDMIYWLYSMAWLVLGSLLHRIKIFPWTVVLQSISPTVWDLVKWLPFCQLFQMGIKTSIFEMGQFSNGKGLYLEPHNFRSCLLKFPILNGLLSDPHFIKETYHPNNGLAQWCKYSGNLTNGNIHNSDKLQFGIWMVQFLNGQTLLIPDR